MTNIPRSCQHPFHPGVSSSLQLTAIEVVSYFTCLITNYVFIEKSRQSGQRKQITCAPNYSGRWIGSNSTVIGATVPY